MIFCPNCGRKEYVKRSSNSNTYSCLCCGIEFLLTILFDVDSFVEDYKPRKE